MLRWSCVHILAQGPCQGQYNIQEAIIVEAVALTEVCWNEHEEQRRRICKLILHTHRVHHCCLRVIPDNVLDSNIFLENCSRPTSRVETSTAKRQKNDIFDTSQDVAILQNTNNSYLSTTMKRRVHRILAFTDNSQLIMILETSQRLEELVVAARAGRVNSIHKNIFWFEHVI